MKKLSMLLITIFIFGLSTIGNVSAEVVLFKGTFERGNAIFERAVASKGGGDKGNGTPVSQFKNFSGMSGEATLKVCNGDESEKISSATISINGNVVVGSSNFNQNVGCMEEAVSLNEGDNILEVLLKSKPGGKVSVEILQLQPDIPPSSDVCDGDGTYLNTWIETIGVGVGNPYGISVSHDGDYVYVTHPLSDTVSVIPTSENNPVIEPITVGKLANGISASPDGKYVYVTLMDGKLSVISLSDSDYNTVIKTITVGYKPWGVSVSPNGEYVYVSHSDTDGTVSIISTSDILETDNPPIKTVSAGAGHKGVSVSPDGSYVYVSNYLQEGTVSAIPISENSPVIEPIAVGVNPTGVSVSPDGKYVYVVNSGNSTVPSTVSVISICDNNTVIDTINVGWYPTNLKNPTGVSVSPDGNYVYVTDYVTGGTVSVFGLSEATQ
jgi:YVTN family beta-propeller protein